MLLLVISIALLARVCRASELPVLEVPLGRAQLDKEEWQAFLRENLEPDLKYWRKRAPLKAEDVLTTYNMTLKVMNVPAVIQLVLIYNNTIYWPKRPDPTDTSEPTREWASSFNKYLHLRLGKAISSGRVSLPNVLFVYNTDDNAPRFNSPSRSLPVPLLSLIKSAGLKGGDDLDILVPQMFHVRSSMYLTPWHLKKDRAFFRGVGFCSGNWFDRYPTCPDPCARTFLSYLSERDRRAGNATALDVGLVEKWQHRNPEKTCLPYNPPVLPRVSIGEHSRYKWLLHLEGITASSRLGLLFLTNSLVLMQHSPWLEHFYRSLRPWVHYVPFWNATAANLTTAGVPGLGQAVVPGGGGGGPAGQEQLGMDDLYGSLAALRRLEAESPEALQKMVAAANEFAVRYLTPYGRAQYYRAALEAYKSLFADMDEFVERYVAGLRAAGWRI